MRKLAVYNYVVDLFKEPIFILIGSISDATKWVDRRFGVDLTAVNDGHMNGMHWCLDGGDRGYANIIWMPDWDNSVNSQDTLLHEVVHYVAEVLEARNIPLVTKDKDNNTQSEFLAYFISYIYTELLNCILEGELNNGKRDDNVSRRGRRRGSRKNGRITESDEVDSVHDDGDDRDTSTSVGSSDASGNN